MRNDGLISKQESSPPVGLTILKDPQPQHRHQREGLFDPTLIFHLPFGNGYQQGQDQGEAREALPSGPESKGIPYHGK